ncbi:hypothetical protein [Streptosporangium sandarakinum]|uniref:hypothetical protein n=1 Tax=Streptosporangium sandarakinum TaxID=1260955 RepID=UPI00378ACCA9
MPEVRNRDPWLQKADGEDLAEPGPAQERLRDVIGLFSGYVDVGDQMLSTSRRQRRGPGARDPRP